MSTTQNVNFQNVDRYNVDFLKSYEISNMKMSTKNRILNLLSYCLTWPNYG
jgi:hypothetical protein